MNIVPANCIKPEMKRISWNILLGLAVAAGLVWIGSILASGVNVILRLIL